MPVFEKAVKDLRDRGIDVVVHTIFGLPKEEKDDMIETIRYLSSKDIQGIKIHLLHLMKDTLMVRLYEDGKMKFMSQEEYIELIGKAISLLPPGVVVHRVTGDAPRDLLIEPQWSLKKWEVLNAIDKYLEDNDIYQGKEYVEK